jgi:hypothetical protein
MLRPVANHRHERGVIACMRLLAATQRQTHATQERPQVFELFGRWPSVHAIQPRMFVALEEVGGAHVRGQHAFLDQPVRVIAMPRHDLLDLALRIADDVRFGRIEIDCATLLARRVQRLVDTVQVLQLRQEVGALRSFRSLRVGQNRGDFRISQPGGRMHYRRIELVGLDLAARGDHHVAYEHATVHLRIQRTQPVRQLLGQHWNHATREIHRCAAIERINIQRLVRAHVMRHVGNRDQ